MRPYEIPIFHDLTKAVHGDGDAVVIQTVKCKEYSNENINGFCPIASSSGFNLDTPTHVRGQELEELTKMARAK